MVSSLAQQSERTNGETLAGKILMRPELMCVLVRLQRWLGEGDTETEWRPGRLRKRVCVRLYPRRLGPANNARTFTPRRFFSTAAGRPSAHYCLFLRLRHFDFPMPNDFVHLCVIACPAAASPSSPSRTSAFPRADHSRCESGRCVTAMTRLLYTGLMICFKSVCTLR